MRGVVVVAVVMAGVAAGQILTPQQQDRLLLPKLQHVTGTALSADGIASLWAHVWHLDGERSL